MAIHGTRHIRQLCRIFLFLPVIVFLSFSCSSTRHVPDDSYLLNGYKVDIDNSRIDESELRNYIKPKANKEILGVVKFYLRLYSMSRKDKENGFNQWLRKIGEEPVLYDEFDTEKNHKQIRLYLKNKGYYYSEVSDTVKFSKKKARVKFDVQTGEPFIIKNINYHFEDTTLRSLILEDTMNSVIREGGVFDEDLLQQERSRIERRLKQSGYYNFNKDYIYYRADTARKDLLVDLTVQIKEYLQRTPAGNYIQVPHRKYRINDVLVYLDFDPRLALIDQGAYRVGLDSMSYDNIKIFYDGELQTSPTVIAQSIFLFPGEEYKLENVEQSYKHLSSLRIFKLVNIEFSELDSSLQYEQEIYDLDCQIKLSSMTLQNYAVELTGTNSDGNMGAAGNLNYQHRNLFRGAENFNFRIMGALEAVRGTSKIDYMLEFGAEARLTFPKFILPFKHESFIRKYNPKTNFTIAYNYQKRPDYTRAIVNTSFGYIWKGNRNLTHFVNPLEISLVKMYRTTSEYIGTYLEHSFEDKLIPSTSYSFVFNNQDINKLDNFTYLRYHVESSGFLLSSGVDVLGTNDGFAPDSLFKSEFSQYVKSGIDLRFYNIIDDHSSIAYRLFMGTAYPYGNSRTIPFEKQYFSGGANGIRAWQVRDLGPGSFREPESNKSRYPNKTGDIKLEANFEYRFKLFWVLEGALFLDAGNVWAISMAPQANWNGVSQVVDFEPALFKWDRFYKEIAVGTGLGIRMDFDFFIFRLDLGLKVRDPQGEKWIMFNNEYANRSQLNLAIGYPF